MINKLIELWEKFEDSTRILDSILGPICVVAAILFYTFILSAGSSLIAGGLFLLFVLGVFIIRWMWSILKEDMKKFNKW